MNCCLGTLLSFGKFQSFDIIFNCFGIWFVWFWFRHGFVMLDVQRILAMYGLKHKLGDIHIFDDLMIRPYKPWGFEPIHSICLTCVSPLLLSFSRTCLHSFGLLSSFDSHTRQIVGTLSFCSLPFNDIYPLLTHFEP